MKKLLLVSYLLLLAVVTFAQSVQPCLFDAAIHATEKQYPGYRDLVNETFKTAQIQGNVGEKSLYTIPVIIHVVWKNEEEKISMARIDEQMDVLNECYRRQNPDTINMRPVFQSVAGDPMIEFVLSEVKYVQTSTLFETEFDLLSGEVTLPDNVKKTSEGGSNIVSPSSFLNIWICKLQPISLFGIESPLLGYAYPPADLDNWPANSEAPNLGLEGVVLDYQTVGRGFSINLANVGNIAIEGRTAVHEVGHYLGLRHIWGDGEDAVFGQADCNATDGISDTPKQGLQSNFDCNASQNTCTEVSDKPDMIENYMDYSSETCSNSFTNGQIELMRGVLEGPRNGLLIESNTQTLPSNNQLVLAPNPAMTSVTLRYNVSDAPQQVFITNVLGENIAILQPNKSDNVIDVSQLANGIYWVTAMWNNQRAVQKLVVQH